MIVKLYLCLYNLEVVSRELESAETWQFLHEVLEKNSVETLNEVRLCCVFRICCRHHSPYQRHEKLNSVRPLNYKAQASRTATKVTVDSDTEKRSMVTESDCRRKRDPSNFSEVSATSIGQSSKWSKFLSSDVTDDGSVISSQIVSDDDAEKDSLLAASGCTTTNLLPSTVSTSFSL